QCVKHPEGCGRRPWPPDFLNRPHAAINVPVRYLVERPPLKWFEVIAALKMALIIFGCPRSHVPGLKKVIDDNPERELGRLSGLLLRGLRIESVKLYL